MNLRVILTIYSTFRVYFGLECFCLTTDLRKVQSSKLKEKNQLDLHKIKTMDYTESLILNIYQRYNEVSQADQRYFHLHVLNRQNCVYKNGDKKKKCVLSKNVKKMSPKEIDDHIFGKRILLALIYKNDVYEPTILKLHIFQKEAKLNTKAKQKAADGDFSGMISVNFKYEYAMALPEDVTKPSKDNLNARMAEMGIKTKNKKKPNSIANTPGGFNTQTFSYSRGTRYEQQLCAHFQIILHKWLRIQEQAKGPKITDSAPLKNMYETKDGKKCKADKKPKIVPRPFPIAIPKPPLPIEPVKPKQREEMPVPKPDEVKPQPSPEIDWSEENTKVLYETIIKYTVTQITLIVLTRYITILTKITILITEQRNDGLLFNGVLSQGVVSKEMKLEESQFTHQGKNFVKTEDITTLEEWMSFQSYQAGLSFLTGLMFFWNSFEGFPPEVKEWFGLEELEVWIYSDLSVFISNGVLFKKVVVFLFVQVTFEYSRIFDYEYFSKTEVVTTEKIVDENGVETTGSVSKQIKEQSFIKVEYRSFFSDGTLEVTVEAIEMSTEQKGDICTPLLEAFDEMTNKLPFFKGQKKIITTEKGDTCTQRNLLESETPETSFKLV